MAERAAELPPEGEKLLAAAPDEFVAERTRVARELREAGRAEEAQAVAALKKPSLVVLAVNRAARDRPQSAQDAAGAAESVRKAQLSGKADAYRQARDDLDRASALLAEVALAHLSRGKEASAAMQKRVVDLLRAAIAEDETRAALVRGALVEELEAPGFVSFEGATFVRPPSGPGRKTERADPGKERRRAREQELREELARAEEELRAAERRLAEASRERDEAERAVKSVQKKIDRL